MLNGSGITRRAIVVFGLGMGGVGALTPLVIFDMFGLKQFGSIMGLTWMSIGIQILLGPIFAGMIFDLKGNYDLMFVITITFLFVSIESFMLAKPTNTDIHAKESVR